MKRCITQVTKASPTEIQLVLKDKQRWPVGVLYVTQITCGDKTKRTFANGQGVGVATVLDAKEVLVIITGTHKAYALAKCIEEGVNHMFTVSAIQMHPKAVVVCDEDATLELRVRTAKYFKSLPHREELLGGPVPDTPTAKRKKP